jgi:hypothetical protein
VSRRLVGSITDHGMITEVWHALPVLGKASLIATEVR